MKKRLLFVLIALLTTMVTWASDVVTIGEPTATYGHMLPIGASNKYALTQQVYTTSEFTHAAGKIWSIGFNTVKGNISRHLNIYVTHTTNNGVYDYTPVTENDLYFSGDMFFKAGQWNTLEFSKPFEYDGTSNLLITICDDTGTKGDYSSLTNRFYNPSSTQLIYATSDEQAYDATDANTSMDFTSISSWKAQIQLTFADYPTPAGVVATDISNTDAKIQCSLRGGATSWNCRVRKVAAEGEAEQNWIEYSHLDGPVTLADLTPATKYEAQAQAIFEGDNTSDWTASVEFVTSCCPQEEMCEILYSMNVGNSNDAAFQIVDDETGIEVGYIQLSQEGVSGGYLSLCKDRKYNVNFLKNNSGWYQTRSCTFSLFFTPGDEIYTMPYNGSPEEDGLLTSFVMECGNYCTPRPRFVTVDNVTCQSATLNYQATTKKEEIQYSTDPTFPEDKTTTIEVTRDAVESQTTYQIDGLESLTIYYIRVRSICEDEEQGEQIGDKFSRWTPLTRIVTDTKFAHPSRVATTPVNSTTEDTAWKRNGMEGKNNVNYRTHGAGTTASAEAILLVDLDGDGRSFDNWGGTNYFSEGGKAADNVIGIANVPKGAMVSWKSANAKTGSNTAVRYQYGFIKQEKKYGEDETGIAEAKAALDAALKAQKEKEEAEEQQQEEDPLPKLLEEAQDKEIDLLKATVELGTMSDDDPKKELLEAECKLLDVELDELRNQIADLQAKNAAAEAAETAEAGVSGEQESNEARSLRAPEDEGEYYFFYIRHHADESMLLVSDIAVTPPENIGEWITIPDVTDVEYTLRNLQSGKEYEVMVQPVYDSGFVGIASPISIFSTIGEETEPMESEFSVSKVKTVNFAKGNLRFNGATEKWSLAPQQYDMLGEANIEAYTYSSYPADLRDLLCWSTAKNYYGTQFYYSMTDEEAAQYFLPEFADYGTNPDLIRDLGSGWATLSKDEWEYLLNGRENADKLKSLATVNDVRGLILLPDNWTEDTPAGTFTAEEWATLEKNGAVFLPAAGQMTAVYADYKATTTLIKGGEEGFYWTGTPSDEETDNAAWEGYVLNFNDSQIQSILSNRRVASAVRLVKVANISGTLDEGDCGAEGDGSNVHWSIDAENGVTTLDIEGTGDIATPTADDESSAGARRAPQLTAAYPWNKSKANPKTNAGWTGLDVLVIGEGITNIPEASMSYQLNMKTATIPSTIVNIGDRAFEGTPLTTVELADKVETIGSKAFAENKSLTELTCLATTPPAAGETMFKGCSKLEAIYVPAESVETYKAAAGWMTYKDLIKPIGGTTAINGINVLPGTEGRWYTLDGRRLVGKPTQKGLYIINGKKVIVK